MTDTVLEGIVRRYLEALNNLSSGIYGEKMREYLKARDDLYEAVGMEFPK